LRILPFGALLSSQIAEGQQINYSQLPYLIKEYNINYLTSVSLEIATQPESKLEYDLQFMGFAPIFSPKKNNRLVAEKNVTNRWAPLIFTDYEVKTIASNFKDNESIWNILPWYSDKSTKLYLNNE